MAHDAARKDLEAELDELYRGDPGSFVERRRELAKSCRAAGEQELAAEVAALRKPTRGAWAINQLGASTRDRLLAAGQVLRDEQERLVSGDGSPGELRAAQDGEREAVQGALLALEDAWQLSAAGVERARQTLHAVALDPEVRELFVNRRLTSSHEAAGLGALPTAAPAGKRKGPAREAGQATRRAAKARERLRAVEEAAQQSDRERREAERAVDDAVEDAEEAQRGLARARAALEKARRRADAAHSRLDRLRDTLGD